MRLSMPGFGLILAAEFLGATGGDPTSFHYRYVTAGLQMRGARKPIVNGQ